MKGKIEQRVRIYGRVPDSTELLPADDIKRRQHYPRAEWMRDYVLFYFTPANTQDKEINGKWKHNYKKQRSRKNEESN
jgi:hypothetical protein